MQESFFISELGAALNGEIWPVKLRQWAIFFSEQISDAGYLILVTLAILVYLYWALIRLQDDGPLFSIKTLLVFSLLSFFVLLSLRWPTFVWDELNPDESFLIASAMRLSKDPIFWRSVDGLTSGPLNIAVLVPLLWVGLSIDFATARLVGLLLLLIAIVVNFNFSSQEFGRKNAALISLILLVVIGGISHPEFVHYGSEQVTLVLIGVSYTLVLTLLREKFSPNRWTLFVLGILLGLVPFAKLQGIPIALYLGFSSLLVLIFRSEKQQIIQNLSYLISGSLLPVSMAIAICFMFDIQEDAWISYITSNLTYASHFKMTFGERITLIWGMIETFTPIYLIFTVLLVGFILSLLTLTFQAKKIQSFEWRMIGFSFVFILFGILAAISPARNFFHYLWLILLPLIFSLSLLLCIIFRKSENIATILIASLFIVSLESNLYFGRRPFLEPEIIPKYQDSFVGRLITALRKPGDSLSVWGWCAAMYPQVGLPPATRDGHTERQVAAIPSLVEYYRSRYLKDFLSSQTSFFLDSVGYGPCSFGFRDRRKYSHEHFPELNTLINDDYQFVADQDELRLYVHSKRLASIVHSANLYPLMVYLDLTKIGTGIYNDFDRAYSSTLNVKWRKKAKKIPSNETELFELQKRITNRTLDLIETTGGASKTTVKEIRESASKRAELAFNNLEKSSNSVESIMINPIRVYRESTDPLLFASLP